MGAVGLMQIIATAAGRDAYYRLYKKRLTPTVEQLKDPYTNLQLGSAYLKLLEEHHFGHISDTDLKQILVLAAYNWGPFNVKRNILAKNPPRTVEEMKWVLWTKAPRETYNYVNRVLKYQAQFSQFDTLVAANG
jgi:soluble lytic murein transglycosylase-like protein